MHAAAQRECVPCTDVCRGGCCRYETNLLNTAGQAMDFLSDIQHDNVYVHLVRRNSS